MVHTGNKQKIAAIFPERGVMVDKSLAHLSEQFRKLPTFVVDYLISEMVNPTDPTPGLERISKLLSDHFMESDQKELVKSRIREHGEYTLIGRIRCRFDEGKDEYWVDVTSLGNQYVRINPHLIAEYGDTLLTTGAWGVFKIVYDESYVMRKKLYPFLVTEFRPMQITGISLDTWVKRREQFTDDEWLDLMITSIGFDPECLSRQEKLLYMVRLVPFIEANVNLCELGPPETGKTFAYQSLSSHGFVVSGGQTTVASLFYDKLRRQLGLVGYRDVVMFDEFASGRNGNKWSGQGDLIDMLKDFMNSGRFGRGTAEFASGCSIMFAGNIDCDRTKKAVAARYRSLFAPLPQAVNQDRAFLDRVHGFIPGWEIPQIRESKLAKGLGFMADYVSEIMHRMRDRNYAPAILENVCFGDMSQRNQRSLVRIGSGLLKLMFPHRTSKTVEPNELKVVLDMALDLRQRVVDQLAVILPSEFSGVKLAYEIKGE
ncbi:MAG: BREX system Lon protease-like protein BrxL [Chloroflexi bacterium]|nr:MAG: BREX system Lon protease-like protein BrxL [Chloroflexota bacterium]